MPIAHWPDPLGPGDRVGVAALSGWAKRGRLARGVDTLRELGFEPVLAPNLEARDGVFAGTDEERLEGLHHLAAQADIRAIFFLRGGHGLLRLLGDVDWDLLGRERRTYVGYSDVTPLLLELGRRFGLVTFHGPMVGVEMARGLTRKEGRSLLASLSAGPVLRYKLDGPASGARVEGPLTGGCLSLLSSLSGTPFSFEPEPSTILFWEDVEEPYYRVDRMLTQLRLSGSVSPLSGMVMGRTGLDTEELDRLGREFGGSFAVGLSSGHCRPNLTVPLGAVASLDPRRRLLEIDRSRARD